MKRYFTCVLLLGFFIWLPNAFAESNGVLSLDAPTHVRQLQNNSDGVLLTLRVNNIQVQASWRVSNAVTAFGIDEDRGVLSLSAEAQTGKLLATVYVVDEFSLLNEAYANLTASAVISVEILSGLLLSGVPRLTVVAGEVVHTLSVSGASGDKTYGVFGGDGYFGVDELSGVLSVSGDAAVGSYTLTIEVMDDNATVQVLATVAVLAALMLDDAPPVTVIASVAMSLHTFMASGGIGVKTYTLVARDDNYFSVNATSGVLSVWSSVTVGIYTLLVEVSDGRSQATAMAVVEVVSSLSLVAVPRVTVVGGEVAYTLSASGGIGGKTYTLVAGDDRFAIVADSGILSLSADGEEGLYTLTLGVIDGRDNAATAWATVEVSAALVLDDAPPVTVIASVAMSLHTFMASGGIGVKTYTLVARDDNYFSVNATSGVLSLSVGIAAGLHIVTVRAIDMDNRTVDGLATVGVSAALSLADAPRLSVATETDAGFYTFVAEGGIGSKTYTIIAGEDAEHFSLGASNGVLSLSGASVRVYTLSIQATDSRGHVASALATVAVLSLYLADVLTLSVIEGREEKVHTFMVDGGGGYTYTLVSGNEDYFSIDAGGVLSVWSSVTVGIYTLQVEVSDGSSQDTAMAVVDVVSSLSLFGVPRVTVVVGEVAYTLSASGGIGDKTYTLLAGDDRFAIGAASGILSLSADGKEGLYTLTLGVIDGRDNAATAWATVEVSAALMLVDAPPLMVIASVAMSLHTFMASGGIGVKTYTLVTRDDHYFSVNATSGVLSLVVSGVSVGLYTVTVRAIDADNRTIEGLATVGVSATLLLVDAPRLSVAVNTTAGFHTFVAEGGIGSKTYTIIAGGDAQHFSLGASNGVLSLSGASVRVYTLSIQATDSRGHIASALATVVVLSLYLADALMLSVIEGREDKVHTFIADGGIGKKTYTLIAGNEDYFSVNAESGVLSVWSSVTVGIYTLSVEVSDESSQVLALAVVDVRPSLSLFGVPRVTVVGGDMAYTLSASGGIGAKTYTLGLGVENYFVVDASVGVLSLLSNVGEGLYTLTLGVIDRRGNTAHGLATLVVSAALSLLGAPSFTVIASVAMSLHTFEASGGVGSKTYMLVARDDNYFSVNATSGVLSLAVGVSVGLYTLTVRAIDTGNRTVDSLVTVGVSGVLALAEVRPLFGAVNTTVSLYTFMASGGIGAKTYTIVSGNEDYYFNLGMMNGVLSLTSNAPVGFYTLSVQARDSRDHVAWAVATVGVVSLYLANPPKLYAIEGRATNLYTLMAEGGSEGNEYTIIAGHEGGYFAVNATSGVLSVLSSVTVGVYPLSVAVSDDEDNRATALVIVEVVLSLSLSEVPPLTAVVGDAVYTLSASGGIGDKTYTLVAGHRDYFSLDETDGVLSVAATIGLYTLTLGVIDGRGNMAQGVATVEISAALVLATVPSFTVIASVAMSLHKFEASGGIGSKTYTLMAHDDNYFSVNATSGVLSLASNTPPKIYTLSLVVLDTHQNQVKAMITVDVRAALLLVAPLLSVLVGEAKDIYTLRASGGIGAKNYNLEDDTEYFVLAANGVLSVQGSITVGKYTLSVVVLDDAGQAGAVVTVEIRPTLSLVEVPLLFAIDGVVEKIYTLTARGGIGDYTYSLVSAVGFTVSNDGVLSSEGSEAGSYTLTVWVADGRVGQAQAMVRVEVASLILADAPLLTVLLGHMVSLHVFTARGGDDNKTYTLLAGPAVQYFSLDEVSGVLSITGFASVGVYTLSVVVTSGGNQAEASALVEVVSSLSIMALPPLVVVTGVAMDIYTLMVSGGVGAKTYTLAAGNDAGYFVLAAQGILSVKAGITAGVYTLSLGVIDAWDYEVYALVTITALLPLLLSDVPLLSVVVGEGKSFYQITAFGGGEKIYRIVPEHEYFVLEEESGVLSVLASVSVGVYTLSLQVEDGHNRALALATVEAVWPLSLVSVPFLTVATGKASVYTFVAAHGIGAKAYTIRSGQGTQYFVLSETSGVLSVLSSVSLGIYTLSVAVQDEGGYTVQAEAMIEVVPSLSFTGASLVAFAKLSREVHEFVSSGGIGAKSYAVVSGNEGGYFVLGAESGVLSVMRAKEGRYNLSVEVSDSAVLPNRVTVLAVVEILSNQIFVLGGNDGDAVTNDVWSSSDGEEWFRWREADWSARDGHQVVVHQGRLYMLGGDYKNDVWSSVDGHQWLLETAQAGWSGRSGHQVVSHQGRLYVLGGATSSSNNIADVWSSVDGRQWVAETSAPGWQARNGHQAVSYQGRLYVLGGIDTSDDDVWFSADGKNWSLAASSVGLGYEYQAVVSQEKMYVLGGFDSDGNKNNDVWSSTDGKNWSKDTTAGGRWSARTGHQALSYDGQLYVLGGDGSNLLNDVWSWESGQNWSLVENLASWTARSKHQAVVFPPPLLVEGARLSMTVGISSSNLHTFVARYGLGDYTYSLSPTVTSFNVRNDGVLSTDGEVNEGEYVLTIWVEDEEMRAKTIARINVATFVVPPAHLFAVVGRTVSLHTFTALGGIGDKRYELTVGNDEYFRLTEEGGLSALGQASVGVYTLVVQASDDNNNIATNETVVEIVASLSLPDLSLTAVAEMVERVTTFVASGGIGAKTYSLVARHDNDYFAIEAESGALSVINAMAGLYTLSVGVSDARGNNTVAEAVVSVVSFYLADVRLVALSTTDKILHTLVASGGRGEKIYTIVAGNADGYFNLGAQSGELSVANAMVSVYFLVIEVRDSGLLNRITAHVEVNITRSQMFVLGGYGANYTDINGEQKSRRNDVWSLVDESTWTIAITTGYWNERSRHQVVAHQGTMYLLGGFDEEGEEGDQARNDVWSSSDGHSWELVMDNSEDEGWAPRYYHQAVSHKGRLYVLGGQGEGDTYYNDVWSSPDGRSWSLEKGNNNDSWVERHSHQVVSHNGRLYLLGGDVNGSLGKDVWYSEDGKTWTQEDVLSDSWSGRYSHQAVSHRGRLYVLGGLGASTPTADVWSSVDGKKWSRETNQAGWSGRAEHQVVSYDDRLYVLGGDDSSFKNDVWSSADGKHWSRHADAPWSPRSAHQAVILPEMLLLDGVGRRLSLTVGIAGYLHTFKARYGDGDYTYSLAPAVTGFEISKDGVLSADHTAELGEQMLIVWVQDGLGVRAQTAVWVEVIPMMLADVELSVLMGQAVSLHTFTAIGGAGSKDYTLIPDHEDFELGPASGVLSVLGQSSVGVYTLSVQVFDNAVGHRATAEAVVSVVLSLSLSSVHLFVIRDLLMTVSLYSFVPRSGIGAKTYTLLAGGDGSFVVAPKSGELAMLPRTSVGIYTLAMQAEDAAGYEAKFNATVEVKLPLSLSASSFMLTVANVLVRDVLTLTAIGGIGSQTYTLVAGHSAGYFGIGRDSGVLSLVQTVIGSYLLTVGVTDARDSYVQATVMVAVVPLLANIQLKGLAGRKVTLHQFVAAGGLGSKTYRLVEPEDYFVVDPESGVLVMDNAEEGDYEFLVAVEDSATPPTRATATVQVAVSGEQIFVSNYEYVKNDSGGLWSSADGQNWQEASRATIWSERTYHQMVAHQGRLYLLGGEQDGEVKNDVWSSVDGQEWSLVTPAAAWSARSRHQAVSYQGRLYVLGRGDSGKEDNDVWSSVDGQEWSLETSAAAWPARQNYQAVAHHDRLYVLGGLNAEGSGLIDQRSDVWSSRDGQEWELVTLTASWSERSSHQVVSHNGLLYLLGGGLAVRDVWSSFAGRDWTLVTEAAAWLARPNYQAVSYRGRLYVLFGNFTETKNVWSSVDGREWKPEGEGVRLSLFGTRGYRAAVFPPALRVIGTVERLSVTVGIPQDNIYTMVAHNGSGPYTYELIPEGSSFAISEHGVLSFGGNAVAGDYMLTVRVRDRNGVQAHTPLRVTIASPLLADAQITVAQGRAISLHTFTLRGAAGANTYTIVAGNGDGYFALGEQSGILSALGQASVGDYILSVQVQDGRGNTARAQALVQVSPPLAVAVPLLRVLAEIPSEVHRFVAAHGIGVKTYTLIAERAGYFSLGASGRLSVASAMVGSYTVSLAVQDSAAIPEQLTVTVEVDVVRNMMFVLGGGVTVRNDVWSSAKGLHWALEKANNDLGWVGRNRYQAVSHQGQLYVLGGERSDGSFGNDVWSSANSEQWSLVQAAAGWSARRHHQAVSHQGRLYVLGGLRDDGIISNDVWSWVEGGTWREDKVHNNNVGWPGRYYYQAVSHNGRLYVLGGSIENSLNGFRNDVWSSVDGKIWMSVRANAAWSPRHGHQAVSHNGRLYVLGGYEYENQIRALKNDVWSSVDGKSWSLEKANADWSPRHGHQALSYQGRLYVLGGNTSDGGDNDVWSSVDGKSWELERPNNDDNLWARYLHQAVVFPPSLFLDHVSAPLNVILGYSAAELSTLVAHYGDRNYTYSLPPPAPPGFSIDKDSGVLSFSDGNVLPGNYTLVARVTDGDESEAYTAIPVQVQPLVLPDVEVTIIAGQAMSVHTFMGLGGGDDKTYMIVAGDEEYFALAGESGEVLSVTAGLAVGSYTLSVLVNDGMVNEAIIAKVVVNAVLSLSWSDVPPLLAVAERATDLYTVMANDGVGVKTYSLMTELDHITLAANGVLSLSEKVAVGLYTLSVLVVDSGNYRASGEITVITKPSLSLTVPLLFAITAEAGDLYTLSASGGFGDKNYMLVAGNNQFTVARDGVLSWSGDASLGRHTLSLAVRDDSGRADTVVLVDVELTLSLAAVYVAAIAELPDEVHTFVPIGGSGAKTYQLVAGQGGYFSIDAARGVLSVQAVGVGAYTLSVMVQDEDVPPRQVTAKVLVSVVRNQIFVMAGYRGGPGTTTPFLDDVWFSADGKNWAKRTSGSWPVRDLSQVVAHQGRLYVLGGQGGDNNYRFLLRDVWSSETGKYWRLEKTPSWSARYGHQGVSHQGRIYVLGGYSGNIDGEPISDVWSSGDGTTWRLETDEAPWGPRIYHQVVSHNGRLYLLSGGEQVNHQGVRKTDVWSSVDGRTWRQEVAVAPWADSGSTTGRTRHRAVSHQGALYVMGGHGVRDIWSSRDGKSWSLRTDNTPWGRRQASSLVSYQGLLYVLGGLSGGGRNDVWSSRDGGEWSLVKGSNSMGWSGRYNHNAIVFPPSLFLAGVGDGLRVAERVAVPQLHQFVAEYGDGDYTYSLSPQVAGITLDNDDGVLSADAEVALGSYRLTVWVRDGEGSEAQTAVRVDVSPLVLANALLLSVVVGQAASLHTFMAISDDAVTYRLSDDAPQGFSIDEISGVLSVSAGPSVGIYILLVHAEDSVNNTVEATAMVEVVSSLSLEIPLLFAITGVARELATLAASNGIGARTYTLVAGDLAYFSLVTSGVLSLSPGLGEGVYTLTIRVMDKTQSTASAAATVRLSAAVMLADAPPIAVFVSTGLSLHTFTASGGVGDKTYRVLPNDGYFLIDEVSGVLSLSSKKGEGFYVVTVQAIDRQNNKADAVATVELSAAVFLTDAPDLTVVASMDAGMGTSMGMGLYTFSAERGGGTKTYTLIAAASDYFMIDGSSGILSISAPIDIYTLSVAVSDSSGSAGAVLVVAVVPPLSWTTIPLLTLFAGAPATVQMFISGGVGVKTYTLVADPTEHFSLATNGVLSVSGEVTAGIYTLSLQVQDETGHRANTPVTVEVPMKQSMMWVLGGARGALLFNDVWSSVDGISWSRQPDAGWSKRSLHQAVAHRGQLYVLGGRNNDVWASGNGQQWSEKDGIGLNYAAHQAVSHNGYLYLLGGSGNSYSNDVWSSVDGEVWMTVKANNEVGWLKRSSHQAVSHNGLLYVLGGSSNSGLFNDVWSSVDGLMWTEVKSNNDDGWSRRWQHQVVSYGERLYVLGGQNAGDNSLNDVWSSSDGSQWQREISDKIWPLRHSHQAVVYQDQIYVMGGFKSGTIGEYYNDVWSSGDGKNWTEVLATEHWSMRSNHQAVVFAPALEVDP